MATVEAFLEEPVGRFRAGSPAAAFSQRAFRWVFLGSFASNIGTWMQNFTLGALAFHLTRSSAYVGLVTFAQLGPVLVFSPFGGVIADRFDRRLTMMAAAAVQGTLSVALAVVVARPNPSLWGIVVIVFGIGMASAANAPPANAALPELVGRRDLAGAISLNSAQMNAARVVGPMLAGFLVDLDRPARIFLINAATYLFVIGALAIVRFNSMPTADMAGEGPWTRFIGGVREARHERVIQRILVTVSLYSLCSLVFIYQMPAFVKRSLGGDERTLTWVFVAFALGAALGAIAVGTFLSRLERSPMTRVGLIGFAVALTWLAFSRTTAMAFPAAFATGLGYFVVITNLVTVLQEEVRDEVRGRVMGLWMMGWAGMVPVGSLLGGGIIDAVGLTPVFVFGALVALGLAFYCDLRPRPAS